MKIMTSSAARNVRICLATGAASAALAQGVSAAVVITEVDPYGSSATYGADWFELTNTGTSAVSIDGLTMVDNHAASNTSSPYATGATISIGNLSGGRATFGPAALSLAGGVTSLAASQSAVFLESSSSASSSASGTLISAFESAWFGSSVPASLLIGTYDDSGNYGLGTDSDMVNIFNGSTKSSALIASVAFGADGGTPESTFDNAAGLNDATISKKSVAGVNGAFVSANGAELGSPGYAPVPLPASAWLMVSGIGGLGLLARRRKSAAVG